MNPRKLIPVLALGLAVGLGLFIWASVGKSANRTVMVIKFLTDPAGNQRYLVHAGQRCMGAPFAFPSDGMVGYIWDDSFRVGHRHQGIDVFAGTDVGVTPVYAAYPGYLSRAPGWVASVIIRIPSDPLNPGQQIWTYYTHMADASGQTSYIVPAFPMGSEEIWVDEGTLLGYQGNYSGDPANPVGVHLHFSVTKDDGSGKWLNELQIENTLDPSPYLGMDLDRNSNADSIPLCVDAVPAW